MRHCKILTWIIILSTVDFALGAPAAIREGLEISVDVADGGTTKSQKRYDPSDDSQTSNAASTPPTLTQSEAGRIWEEIRVNMMAAAAEQHQQHLDLFGPESSGESSAGSVGSNRLNYASSNPESPTGPGLSEGGVPNQPAWLANPDALSSTSHRPTPPQSPTGGSPLPPLPHPRPSVDRFPGPPGVSLNPDTTSSTGHQPTPPQSPTDSSESPGSSVDRSPSPPGSPGDILDDLLKSKVKRRISGSGTVNSAQRDPRSTTKYSNLMISLS